MVQFCSTMINFWYLSHFCLNSFKVIFSENSSLSLFHAQFYHMFITWWHGGVVISTVALHPQGPGSVPSQA